MQVTVVSENKSILSEFEEKLNSPFEVVNKDTILGLTPKQDIDILFLPDLVYDEIFLERVFDLYPNTGIVINAVGSVIESMPSHGHILGMNLLPTFINRELAEITGNDKNVERFLIELGWQLRKVNSRVGMVTPRVIFMIINEAFYTVQEGTASKESIDTGMKLGTNYPQGPFEWAQKIGIQNIYKTLELIFEDTKEGRYKICPLLKQEYLYQIKSQSA